MIFLLSLFPGYGLAEETGGQSLLPINQSDSNYSDIIDELPTEPVGDEISEPPAERPADPAVEEPGEPSAEPPAEEAGEQPVEPVAE